MTDSELLARVVEEAASRYEVGSTDARRLFHGRGHCFPGLEHLTVDWFPPCLLVSVYRRDVAQEWLDALVEGLVAAVPGAAGVAIQWRDGRRTRAEVGYGEVPSQLTIEECDLRFGIAPLTHQNIGFFLDMAPARQWVRERAQDRSVLNLFAFTCAFSIAAVAGGATDVVNNDMSRSALDRGSANHELNDHDARRVRYVPHNLFKSWWKLNQFGPYGLIVIDPPTNQRGSFVAEKDYGNVMKRLSGLAAPGADVLLCLNSPFLPFHFLTDQMARRCPDFRFVERLQPSPDFPDSHEDRSLKLAVFRAPG